MKIAVTYDNGQVFPHFGRTETFKVYEVSEGKVISSELLGADGAGHEALAEVLSDNGVSLLICGGLGQGAQDALTDLGIVVYSGASGDCDEAVAAFLRGELTNAGVNCDHHEHEQEGETETYETYFDENEAGGCGGGCGGGCSGGCGGGCSGGCGGGCAPQIVFEGPNAGKTCRVHYKGTLDDGSQFDSSYDRGEPLEFICGIGRMIKGFDAAVVNMKPGETVNIHIEPEDAYGMPNPDAIFTVDISDMPGAEEVNAGDHVYLTNVMGQPFPATVTFKDDKTITFDANHEMAGKALNFMIELLEVTD